MWRYMLGDASEQGMASDQSLHRSGGETMKVASEVDALGATVADKERTGGIGPCV